MMRKQATTHNTSYKAVHRMTGKRTQPEMSMISLALPRVRRSEAGDSTSSSLIGSRREEPRRVDGTGARGGATRMGVGTAGGAVCAGVGAKAWLIPPVVGR